MDWATIDWAALERLRRTFLDPQPPQEDYWRSLSDLTSYDQTFGRRIAWKWRHVLVDLVRLGWSAPAGNVLDWGCGTGVAAREYVAAFPAATSQVAFWDRSALARAFACRQFKASHPGIPARESVDDAPTSLLVSHVLGELSPAAQEELLHLARRAQTLLWVEPGTHALSRRLLGIRERLRGDFHPVAPCTHGAGCGLLLPGFERHWCHHFAASPPAIFTDSYWARFARMAGVDLRSLPLSYLVLDRRVPPSLPEDAVRLLGRPRVYKAHALLLGCDTHGVTERELRRRNLPEVFRWLKKDRLDTLQRWTYERALVNAIQPFHPHPPPDLRHAPGRSDPPATRADTSPHELPRPHPAAPLGARLLEPTGPRDPAAADP